MSKVSLSLTVIFSLAMLSGAGPGLFLINGKGPIAGLPAIYAWAVFWFSVQAAIVSIAYFVIWKRKE